MFDFVAKTSTLVMFFILSMTIAWWSYTNMEYESKEQNLTKQLKQKVTSSYLDRYISQAIADENFDDVTMYAGLASMLDINLSSVTLDSIEQNNGFFEKSWRNVKAFGSSFLSGKSDSVVGMSGSIVSDMTLYGDLRDLKVEGTKYNNNEEYDKFILQLSLVGIGLSATQLFSVGASTPLKVGASVMKVAKKSGNITKSFSKILSKRLGKSVDTKVLKTLKPKSLLHLQDTSKVIAKSINLAPVKGIFKEISSIKKFTSTADSIALLKYVDTTNDLRKIGKLSKTYKTNTKGVMKVLGKGALRSGKSVLKYTTKFIAGLIGLVFSVVGFISMLIMKLYFLKKVKGIVS